MKTIVHLIDTGGPGGAESLCARLAADLQSHGMRNVVVVSRDGWLANRLRAAGLAPVILSSSGSVNLRYLFAIVRILRKERADVLMTHLYGSAVYGSIAGALTGTPVLSVLHGQTDVGARGRFTGLKARAVRYGAHRIVFVSQQLAADIRPRLGLSGERCIVVQNGIDLDDFQPGRGFELRRQLGLGADDILVGSVGNIRHPKGYDILLDAARIVCNRFERVHFAIVGEGSGLVYDSILAQRQRLGLNNRVHFLGFRSDINHLLTNFDVYALSSRTEGFSLACVEAMACGLAVVATRSGGPETIITHGESGLLVSPESAAELAAAIGKLAEDPRLRAALAEGGRRRATSAFSARPMLERYRKLILELASD